MRLELSNLIFISKSAKKQKDFSHINGGYH